MKRLLSVLLMIATLKACSTAPTPDGTSGVFGRVTLGPVCPVVQVGESCPDQPYQATLSILAASGDKVARIVTDADGNFRISLVPGDYILQPETPENQPLPIAQEQQFTVTAGQFTELLVTYDSGIR
jgi:hypothetical protein